MLEDALPYLKAYRLCADKETLFRSSRWVAALTTTYSRSRSLLCGLR